MKKFLTFMFTIISVFTANLAIASSPLPNSAKATIRQSQYKHANWYILVKDLNTNKIVYSLNVNKL